MMLPEIFEWISALFVEIFVCVFFPLFLEEVWFDLNFIIIIIIGWVESFDGKKAGSPKSSHSFFPQTYYQALKEKEKAHEILFLGVEGLKPKSLPNRSGTILSLTILLKK